MLALPVLLSLWCLLQNPSLLCAAELVIPGDLTSLLSSEGQTLLFHAQPRDDYFQLSQHFVTQINSAFCGVASSATVLNALEVPRPLQDPKSELNSTRYAYFTQQNIFNKKTESIVPKAQILEEGLSLEDLAVFLSAHEDVGSAYLHSFANNVTLEIFRHAIVQGLAAPDTFVIVNFNRDALNEPGGGHHSPVAAFNAEADSVLVLDVSRYKYTAWWVPVPRLYAATLANDGHMPRGLVLAWRWSSWPDGAPSKRVFATHLGNPESQADLEPWELPGADNGRPWVAPWVHSPDGGSWEASSDGSTGGMSVVVVVVVALLAALLGVTVGLAVGRGGLGSFRWSRDVWEWARGSRGGWGPIKGGGHETGQGLELEDLQPWERGSAAPMTRTADAV